MYVITGLWPILSMATFERVTGPKRDDWLVRTVGALTVAIGCGLLRSRREPGHARPFGLGAAVAFASVDIVGFATGRLGPVYLLDAAAECAIAVGWLISSTGPRSAVRPRP